MNPRVQFEDEADAEYRLAGRWYEGRREHLGLELFDAVDAAIGQILDLPRIRLPRATYARRLARARSEERR